MASIQWRPEINALTLPASWRPRFMPRNILGSADVAARMAKALPNYSEEEFKTFITLHNQIIANCLRNGEQVTEENAFTYALAFSGRMESADGQLPPLGDCMRVSVYASQPFAASVRHGAQTERLPEAKKEPLISSAADTVYDLKDVLNPAGLVRLSGANLRFDRSRGDEGCVIEGFESGWAAQTLFGKIEDSEIIFAPDLPAQAHPWNNAWKISVRTRYSPRGTLRTGFHSKMLRSPLTVQMAASGMNTGILSGSEANPNVSIIGGSVSADEAVRIQVTVNTASDTLLISLLDLREGGASGPAASVAADGELTVQGFSGSAVSSLTLRVNNYEGLKWIVRNYWGGRLTDVLEVKAA